MNEKNIIFDLVNELDAADSLDGCFAALSRSVESLGFRGLVYTHIILGLRPLTGNTPIFLRSPGFDMRFLKHYEEAGLAKDDFTIKRILQGHLDVMDWWKNDRQGLLAPEERRVIEIARADYGIANGISVPTLSTNSDVIQLAGASIISDEGDHHFDVLLNERLTTLASAVRLFHYRTHTTTHYRKFFLQKLLDELNQRDIALLRFTANGIPLKLCKEKLGISPTAAGNQRSRLLDRFGVHNASEMMYIIGAMKLLDST